MNVEYGIEEQSRAIKYSNYLRQAQ